MNFHEPEVIEMGLAEQLIELFALVVTNAENLIPPQTTRDFMSIYMSQ